MSKKIRRIACGESSARGHRIIKFGGFEVDLRAGELRKHGARVRLQQQPLQVLQVLLENPGEVVTREELRQRIWPANTFVDFDHGLNNAIKRLREALGDTAERPQYIETLPRKGYRCVATVSGGPLKIESLAVLPLENLSGDSEQEYFAEGMTEALITDLTKIGALRVVSRTSIMQYKGVRKSLREIARELQVDGVVEGTVQRSGERLRISAQLVHASTDTHLWAENYDRDLRDVLALQSEVARAIARELQVKLTPLDQARSAPVHRVDPEAYDAYLQGRYHWNRRRGEGLRPAVQYFEQAIAKDASYGAAYAGLADCMSVLGWSSFVAPDEGCGRAIGLARKAVELDGTLAEGHASLAMGLANYDYDFVAAEREFERSIELNPRYATAHHWFGLCLAVMGRYEESYTEHKRALRLDPDTLMIRVTLGIAYWCARRYDQALDEFEKVLELEPNFVWAQNGVAYTLRAKSMHERAIAAAQRTIELSRGAPTFVGFLGVEYAAAGNAEEARGILKKLQELSQQHYVTPHLVAQIHAFLGDTEEAFQWLEIGYRERAAWMVLLKTDPCFDGLRSDPRFRDLMRRMNFPEAT